MPQIVTGSLDQNAGESAVQSMDDVKDDPFVGFLLFAHCCHILSRTDMTNSRSVAHNDVDIESPPEWNRCVTFLERYLKSSTLFATEKILQRLLKTECDLYCRYIQRRIVPGEVQAEKLLPRL